jgi:hypothetical protein
MCNLHFAKEFEKEGAFFCLIFIFETPWSKFFRQKYDQNCFFRSEGPKNKN